MSTAVREKINRDLTRVLDDARRPRVLHLINSFEIGGTERQAVELLKRIDAERYDVRLAALRNRGPFYEEIASRFASVSEFPLTSFYNLNALKQVHRLRQLMTRERIEILHAHDFYAGFIGSIAARLAGVKVIASQRHLKLSQRKAHAYGHLVIHRLAHRILVNSEAIRDFIIKENGAARSKIVVIKNGISAGWRGADSEADYESMRRAAHDELCRELGINTSAKIVGTVARLQAVKGHKYLIEAAARVIRDRPNTHFVLVGDGPLRGEIESQASRLAVQENLHFLGDRNDASRLVQAFDVAALASLHEGLPNAVMEAMAAGVVVVATAAGGTTELIAHGKTGYLVAPADASELALQITRTLDDEENSREVAASGHKFIMDRFGIHNMVRSVESLYDQLITERVK